MAAQLGAGLFSFSIFRLKINGSVFFQLELITSTSARTTIHQDCLFLVVVTLSSVCDDYIQ